MSHQSQSSGHHGHQHDPNAAAPAPQSHHDPNAPAPPHGHGSHHGHQSQHDPNDLSHIDPRGISTAGSESSGISNESYGGTVGDLLSAGIGEERFIFEARLHYVMPKSGLKDNSHRYSLVGRVSLASNRGKLFKRVRIITELNHGIKEFHPRQQTMEAGKGNTGTITSTKGLSATTEIQAGPVSIPGLGAEYSQSWEYTPSSVLAGNWFGNNHKTQVEWMATDSGQGVHEHLVFNIVFELKDEDPLDHLNIKFACEGKLITANLLNNKVKHRDEFTVPFHRDPQTRVITQLTWYPGPKNDKDYPAANLRWNRVAGVPSNLPSSST